MNNKPRVLIADIETAPMEAYVWGSWDQNIPYNMLKTDWSILSWAAKWLGDKKIMYQDQRRSKDIRNDKKLLNGIWQLLDEADVVIWQNGKAFDHKKLNARFLLNGLKPPSPYKQIDTKQIAKRNFALTHNSLEYMSEKLNKKYTKSKHKKFVGFDLWRACLAGNPQAWREMEHYNKLDVLSLEEVYKTLQPWDQGVDFNLYTNTTRILCNCGSSNLIKRGFSFKVGGKYQQYQCRDCGAWSSEKGAANNLLPKSKIIAMNSKGSK